MATQILIIGICPVLIFDIIMSFVYYLWFIDHTGQYLPSMVDFVCLRYILIKFFWKRIVNA